MSSLNNRLKKRHTLYLQNKRSLIAGFTLLVFSSWAAALGLGDVKLNSALNEPLDAEIQLLNIGDMSEAEILAGLASPVDFERAGVDREFFLTGLKFDIDLAAAGGPVIRVTSSKAIREPYLDFLVELQWPAGRLLREYTLLLDLPVFAQNTSSGSASSLGKSPAAAPASSASGSSTDVASSTAVRRGDTTEKSNTTQNQSVEEGSEYRVRGGDSLWGIAKRAGVPGASVQQTMVAIHSGNPQAFINGNMNLLRKGAILRLPNAASIQDIDAREAINEVTYQSQLGQEPAETAPQLSASDRRQTEESSADAGGRLKLSAISPEELDAASDDYSALDSSAAEGSDSVSSGRAGAPTEQALAEELDRTRRENSELKERLASLEEQLDTMERMVALNDDQLRAAQLGTQLQASQESSGELSADEDSLLAGNEESTGALDSAESSLSAEGSSPAEGSLPAEGSSPAEGSTTTDAVEAEPVAPEVANQPVALARSKGFFDQIQDYLWYIGAFVALVVLSVVYLLVRSRSSEGELIEPSFSSPKKSVRNQSSEMEAQEFDEDFEQESVIQDTDELAVSSVDDIDLNPDDQLFHVEDEDADISALDLDEEEQMDPAGEADIYLSLENYQEAEDVLNKALANSPKDSKLHLKMLEIYVARKDLAGFDSYLPTLAALQDPVADGKAADMRAEITGEDDDFLGEEPESVDAVAAELEDIDLEIDSGALEIDAAENTEDLMALDSDSAAFEPEPTPEEEIAAETVNTASPGDLAEDEMLDLDAALEDLELELPAEQAKADSDDLSDLELSLDVVEKETAESGSSEDLVDLDDELDLLTDSDETATKLELAKAYVDMGDPEGAREILQEVFESGSEEQQEKARSLLEELA